MRSYAFCNCKLASTDRGLGLLSGNVHIARVDVHVAQQTLNVPFLQIYWFEIWQNIVVVRDSAIVVDNFIAPLFSSQFVFLHNLIPTWMNKSQHFFVILVKAAIGHSDNSASKATFWKLVWAMSSYQATDRCNRFGYFRRWHLCFVLLKIQCYLTFRLRGTF